MLLAQDAIIALLLKQQAISSKHALPPPRLRGQTAIVLHHFAVAQFWRVRQPLHVAILKVAKFTLECPATSERVYFKSQFHSIFTYPAMLKDKNKPMAPTVSLKYSLAGSGMNPGNNLQKKRHGLEG